MKKHGVQINDLHKLSSSFKTHFSFATGDVHYTTQGSAVLGNQVAETIAKALGSKAVSLPDAGCPLLNLL